MAGKLKIKLSAERMNTLHRLYFGTLNLFEVADEHEELLREHAVEFLEMIEKELRKEHQTYTISLKGTAAMAFLQFWFLIPLQAGTMEQVIVQNVIQKIDQKAKSYARILT